MWFRSAPAPPDAASRLCRGKVHGASGATAAADYGLPVGTAEICSATTARTTAGGGAGIYRATGRSPTLSTSMTPMPCGSTTGDAILSFDPKTERFGSFALPDSYANVRQLAGRKGEVWGAESAADRLFMIKTE